MRLLALLISVFYFTLVAEKAATATEVAVVSQTTLDVSKGFSSVVDKVLPAVVSVQATQVVEPRGGGDGVMAMPGMPPQGRMGPGNPLEELFREFMGQMERPRKTQAVGAGFIVHCDGKIAYVVTNHHVVSEAKTLVVVLEDKTELPGTLLASDERNDVAVIKLDLSALPPEKRNLPTVDWASSDNVKTGDWVIAIGNPFNFGNTVTVGVVSHKGRYVQSGMQQDFEFIQHSAQINVGSSGGALFDTNGKVIGINNAIITNTGGNIGIGFAIPANIARQTVDQLIKYGKTRRGQLGIRIQAFDKNMAESQGMEDTGVIVGSVIEKGPADGKLEVGNIILAYEGKKVTESHILSRLVGETEIGKTITLKVWRKGKIIEVNIKVDEMPDAKKADDNKDNHSKKSNNLVVAGLEIAAIPAEMKERLKEHNKESRGVIIVHIDPNSIAGDQVLLMRGDIIEEANNKPLNSPNDFKAIVDQAKKDKRKNILLLISRDGKPAYLPLRIDNPDETEKDQAKPAEKQEEAKPETKPEQKKESKQEERPIEKKANEQVQPEHHDDVQDVDKTPSPGARVAKPSEDRLEKKEESFTSKLIDKVKSLFGKG